MSWVIADVPYVRYEIGESGCWDKLEVVAVVDTA